MRACEQTRPTPSNLAQAWLHPSVRGAKAGRRSTSWLRLRVDMCLLGRPTPCGLQVLYVDDDHIFSLDHHSSRDPRQPSILDIVSSPPQRSPEVQSGVGPNLTRIQLLCALLACVLVSSRGRLLGSTHHLKSHPWYFGGRGWRAHRTEVQTWPECVDDLGMPSGHTAATACFYEFLAFELYRTCKPFRNRIDGMGHVTQVVGAVVAQVLIFSVEASRAVIGAHFPYQVSARGVRGSATVGT